jgi:hypothetical protein
MVGEYCDVFATPSVDLWMSWYTEPDDLVRAAYSVPMTLQSIVVDADPAMSTRGFMLGAQLCLTTHGCEGTLADEPRFAAHVGALADLRARLADRFGTWRFRDGQGLEQSSDGPARAAVFSSPAGPFLVCGSPGGSGRLGLRLDRERLGWPHVEVSVTRLGGGPERAILRRRDRLDLTLAEDEVILVWPEGA